MIYIYLLFVKEKIVHIYKKKFHIIVNMSKKKKNKNENGKHKKCYYNMKILCLKIFFLCYFKNVPFLILC